jgi:hypothetical protein
MPLIHIFTSSQDRVVIHDDPTTGPAFAQKLAVFDFLVDLVKQVESGPSMCEDDKENDRILTSLVSDAELQLSLDKYAEKLLRGLVRRVVFFVPPVLTIFAGSSS